jgi:flavin reductase (DIM6/NTAB) family NADH-FMN oxidoreductase RutF
VTLYLQRHLVIEFPNGRLVLCKLLRTTYAFINPIHQKLLIGYFYWQRQNKISLKELDCFCAAYLYPRKVVLTCFGQPDDYNLFPMDLQGYIKTEDVYVLGLRNTNVTLKKIIAAGKVAVCEVSSANKDALYLLGRHHSSQPPRLSDLPFTFKSSELFQIPVPDIASAYVELEIIKHIDLGSHTVLVGKVVNQNHHSHRETYSLYHQHITKAIKGKNVYRVV